MTAVTDTVRSARSMAARRAVPPSGESVSGAGDVNGDGLDDLIFAASAA